MKKKVMAVVFQPLLVAVIGTLFCLLISFLFAKFGNNLPLSYKENMINGPTNYIAFGIKLSNMKEVFEISFDLLSFVVSFVFIYLISLIFIANFIFSKKNKANV